MAELLIGYGMIGTWDGQGVPLGDALAGAGLNYTEIELNAGLSDGVTHLENLRTAAEDGPALVAFVDAMRARNVVTAILIANWNGAEARAQDTAWFQAWLTVILGLGPELVVVEGVTEPDNADPKAILWQQMTQDQLGGAFTLMANGGGGRGDPLVPGWTLLDYHWCEDWEQSTVLLPPVVNTTDCSPMLNLTPSHAGSLISHAVAAGAYALIYDLTHTSLDGDVITAIGAALPPEGIEIPAFIGAGGGGGTLGYVSQII